MQDHSMRDAVKNDAASRSAHQPINLLKGATPMRVIHQAVVAGILVLALGGCGPLSSPMPPRLNDNDQKEADESWNSAFTPADRLDRQTLMDAFLVSQAYQTGVDRLTMRS